MAYDRFLIAAFSSESGLRTDLKPWLIPEQSFARMQNAYVFRGRLRKRFGSRLMNGSTSAGLEQLSSRVRIALTGGAGVGITDGVGDATGTVPGIIFTPGQLFSIGSAIYTVYQTGAPATMYKTVATPTATYNTVTGVYAFVGAPTNTQIYFYPASPIMGIINYETGAINDEPTYVFDTQFAYQFSGGAWLRLGTAIWTGSNSQFFWGSTYRGVTASQSYLYVVNYNAADQLKYWDGTTWTTIAPIFNAAGDTIRTSRIVIPFKDRLVLLNTIERIGGNDSSFINRCRFSQNGDPTQTTAGQEAFREDVVGKGGYIDAPTKEAIITAGFLKDRLIVYFEASTWELVYTGNQVLPFVWQQINQELGCESTLSIVPFDKVLLGVGNVGVHACNGANVERIDNNIPQAVFDIHNGNQGPFRVAGIRDYYTEMVYWSFPQADANPTFPNRVLVYNYKNATWSFNDDSFTAFGYFSQQDDTTWASSADITWEEADFAWASGTLQSQFRQVLAGNQEGFLFIIDPDVSVNAPSLSITNISYATPVVTLTIYNHNLSQNDYIEIRNVLGFAGINDTIYQIFSVIDANTITIIQAGATGTYTGGGTVTRVSQIDIWTKQFNPYAKDGKSVYIAKIDFFLDKTSNGQITVDYFPSTSDLSMQYSAQATGCALGTGILETSAYALVPLEQLQSQVWHSFYLQADGEFIQLRFYLSPAQMVNAAIVENDFQLHAMVLYSMPISRLE